MATETTIYEIHVPGSLPLAKGSAHNAEIYIKAGEIDRLILWTIKTFHEANAALHLFNILNNEYKKDFQSIFESKNRERKNKRIDEIRATLRKRNDIAVDELTESDLIYNREQWERGILPHSFRENFALIQARGFLFAADTLSQILNVLIADPYIPEKAKASARQFKIEFPELRMVRNSAHHTEDRIRSLKFPRKKIEDAIIHTKEVKKFGIHAREGIGLIMHSNLQDNTLTYITEDGNATGFDITEANLQKMHPILQEFINSFDWRSFEQNFPQ
ncbi:hypothetical protein [Deinococcus altitudinis]|uniref:hypothetical protein n=1 Tax=Deinococcus altitudinis TaxID=468914 RepID=UPI003891EAEC